jgi:hypothetical protein
MNCILALLIFAAGAFLGYHVGKRVGYEEAFAQQLTRGCHAG